MITLLAMLLMLWTALRAERSYPHPAIKFEQIIGETLIVYGVSILDNIDKNNVVYQQLRDRMNSLMDDIDEQ